ncbi:enoyl-CoA hydratase [Perkinsela sp. CCAP 1560/4]|nr:enoyl-CoA hydratase [Perkinsela sp. CCAP 1560/4]|eukprot:KNH08946.1 enoyl-CoA hydratase [Perkinsela sp. CCAP 1560/4]
MIRKTVRHCIAQTRISSPVEVGDAYVCHRRFVKSEIQTFVTLTEDSNAIHADITFARSHGFQREVVPGFLSGSMLGGIMGSHLPGPGSVILSQTLSFRLPVYVNDLVTYEVSVERIFKSTGILTLSTKAFVGDTLVIEGRCIGKLKSLATVQP